MSPLLSQNKVTLRTHEGHFRFGDYKKEEIICVFQPHRISRLKNLKKEFSLSFKNANSVILCPVYAAGEKLKLGFDYLNFAKTIINNSKVNIFLVKNEHQLAK